MLSVLRPQVLNEAAPYTTRLQAGLGLVHETTTLLGCWQVGMGPAELYKVALEAGAFPNVSARRLRNIIVECFAPRYLRGDGPPARYLQQLKPALASTELVQLYFLYTCRANPILGDFVRAVYWDRYSSGAATVGKVQAAAFVAEAIDDGKTAKRWSDSTVSRVSAYLIGACHDYGLLGKATRQGRRISPFGIAPIVSTYLAYDLHLHGASDSRLLLHEDWGLFGFAPDDVRDELKRLALRGQLIVQSAASVTRISWKWHSMQEVVDGLVES
jgi:hypothetical protein